MNANMFFDGINYNEPRNEQELIAFIANLSDETLRDGSIFTSWLTRIHEQYTKKNDIFVQTDESVVASKLAYAIQNDLSPLS